MDCCCGETDVDKGLNWSIVVAERLTSHKKGQRFPESKNHKTDFVNTLLTKTFATKFWNSTCRHKNVSKKKLPEKNEMRKPC
jgi:hypothetical protein